jgi:Ca-activated chloride channel homolog
MTKPTLVLTPRREAILAGARSTAEVLIRLQAPDLPEGALPDRQPLHLALVIDRSGSMSGAPLAEARRCASFVVDGLRADDRVAVVSYDESISTDWPLTHVTDKASIHRAIARIQSQGLTNLHGGWLRGVKELAPHAGPNVLSRVIVLSDGCANRGVTDVDTIARECAERGEAGVSTSTYGLGADFNEALMVAMARDGQGNSYYGQTAEDLMDPFREELALLNALCARRVALRIETPPGVAVEVLNRYPTIEPGVWRLPDLAYGGDAWAVVRLTLEDGVAVAGNPTEWMRVSAHWQDPEGHEDEAAPVVLAVPAVSAEAYAAVTESPLVRQRVQELTVANLQDRVRSAARVGDWAEVERTLRHAEEMARDNPWLGQTLETLRTLTQERDAPMLSKEAYYAAFRMRTRLAGKKEDTFDLPEAGDEIPMYLRRKRAQGRGQGQKDGQGQNHGQTQNQGPTEPNDEP